MAKLILLSVISLASLVACAYSTISYGPVFGGKGGYGYGSFGGSKGGFGIGGGFGGGIGSWIWMIILLAIISSIFGGGGFLGNGGYRKNGGYTNGGWNGESSLSGGLNGLED